MKYYLAPMEGVTGPIYRRTVHEFFGPYDRYYTPFLSPTGDRRMTAKQWNEIDPAHLSVAELVPQLLTNSAENFLWAAQVLADSGYREVNLNLGCPSGTVVKKKKGSGLLALPELLTPMLDEIFEKSPIAVSVKTRLGVSEPEEFGPLLELFNRYPICELTIHPRVQKQLYRGDVHMEAFRLAAEVCKVPLCYNGNLFTPEDVHAIAQAFPDVGAVMLGRGAIANPGMIGRLRNGAFASKEQLQAFHDTLYARYRAAMPGVRPTIFKMRELWSYMAFMFEDYKKPLKHIRKADTFEDYERAVSDLFRTCPYLPDGAYFPGIT